MATQGAATPGFVSRAPRLGFVGGFDGVRGIGILMVLFNHAYSDLSPSFAGIIDVFFVMSAFLIVTLLMQEYRDRDGIDMRKFYARRAVRLLPSAYLCLVAWIVFCLLFDRERLVWVLQDAAAAVTYIYNLVFPVGLASVAPEVAAERSIDQFWSLAVEEQFYLVIAATVLVCLKKRWMVQLAIGLCILAAWIGWQRWTGHTGPINGGMPTDSSIPARGISLLWLSRYDSLMWGVGLAVLNAHLPDPLPKVWKRWLPIAGVIGLVIAGVSMLMASVFLRDTAGKLGLPYPYVPMAVPPEFADAYDGKVWVQYGHTLTALAFMPAMLAMARYGGWWANRALSWKPLRFLGRMSYTVYVWHTFFYFVVLDALGGDEVLGEKWRAPILAAIAVVASLPIFYGVEQRMLRVKLRFAAEKEVLDLNTGKMISVEAALATGHGTVSAEAVEGTEAEASRVTEAEASRVTEPESSTSVDTESDRQ
jgi:peptidoglycan/LPS O-acetylase OafA/YrhL